MKLSVVMMIKNESEHLEKCLMSIKPIQAAIEAEIIIVDTGSEDDSVEIAKRYTDKVYFHQWNNDFGAMRNITISYAIGEWVFILDGDEVIENPEEFIQFFKSKNSVKYNTGFIRINSYTTETETKSASAQIPRLFRKDKDFKYIGAIHEQPRIKGPLYYFNTNILHYGYISTDSALMERKFIRNTEILKSELEKNPENMYYWFQLSQSYTMYKSYEEALEAILMAYEIANKENKLTRSMYIYIHLASVYLLNKRYEEMESICLEALAVKDGYIDLYYFLAIAQQSLEEKAEAIKNYNIYLDMLNHYEDFAGSKDISVTTYTLNFYEEVYTNLCRLYFEDKQYEKVLELKDKIYNLDLLKAALTYIISSYIKLKRYPELKEFYDLKILREFNQITNDFTNSLEANMTALKKQDKDMLIDIFSCGESIYALLNLIRIENKSDAVYLNKTYFERLEDIDFNKLPNYYGEIFYYLLKCKHLDMNVLKHLNDTTIESYFTYIVARYKKVCAEYILSFMNEAALDGTLDSTRIRKLLGRVLLLSQMLYDERYEEVFKQYVKDGICYINQVYNKNIIINEQIYNVKNEEEAMFIYMDRAEELKAKDKIEFIRCLRKALNIYPAMAMGIKIITSELENELNKYQENTIEQIKTLIDTGNFLRAYKLIHEYEKIKDDDVRIISMKAVIAIMENHFDDAEMIIKKGLKIEDKNFDLLYNLKYVYESQGKIDEAEAIQKRIAFSMPTKRCIDPSISLEDFFEKVKEDNIRYIVLKWFDELPSVQLGKNLAILVHDEDLVKISKYFIPYQAEDAVLCEVYSITAISGSTDAGLPGYPSRIAEEILENRVLNNKGMYVPECCDFMQYIIRNEETSSTKK